MRPIGFFLNILTPVILTTLIIGSRIEASSPPVILWHGMGDSCCNPLSLGKIIEVLQKSLGNDSYIKSLQIGKSFQQEVKNSFFMNVNLQVENACKQIAVDPKLTNGYNAVGFSQGAQFLRAVAQRCPNPPMLNLISIGGQHQGVFGMPRCIYSSLKFCEYLRLILNKEAYASWIQDSFVQAEYWHDPIKESDYIEGSYFLADINNERTINTKYRDNLLRLKNFVMVMFNNDTMVIPKESAWFAFYSPGQDIKIMPFEKSMLYLTDRLGLRVLEEDGRLHFISVDGDHLQFSKQWFLNEIVNKYLKT